MEKNSIDSDYVRIRLDKEQLWASASNFCPSARDLTGHKIPQQKREVDKEPKVMSIL